MKKYFYTLLMVLAMAGFTTAAYGQCSTGELTTTDMQTVACDENDTFMVATDGMGEIPTGGGFGWSFSSVLGGTGGIPTGFTLSNAQNSTSYTAGLNGVLPANNLPNLQGLWVVKAVVYSNGASPTASICATSTDSLIVEFLNLEGPSIDSVVDNGDGTATVTASGGTPPYTYLWSDGQETATATDLAELVYTVSVTDANGCFSVGEVAVGDAITCAVGTLTTTGEVLICTEDGTFTVETDGAEVIPSAGGFGWSFSSVLGGTGGLPGGFTLTGADNPSTYNANLNGVLSSNGLPPLEGLWVVKAVVYADGTMATASLCATSEDSLIVNFSSGTLVIDDVVDNGDGSATVTASGGTPPYTYEWSDGQMTDTAVGLAEGTYQVTVTDDNGCTVSGSVSIGETGGEPCLDWLAPSPTGGWTDFNGEFGGAPCDDGDGCPFLEITAFEAWAAEAYTVDNFQEGGTYTFGICNGPGAGSWVPEFTIIAPSGNVDASGPGDGCSITWTATESGTYLLVINEAGECGGGANTGIDNGYPSLTCEGGPEVACEEVACSVGELVTTGEVVVCGSEDTFDLATDGSDEVPETGGFGWRFSDALGGTGGAAGGFTLTGAESEASYNSDLNGVMSGNNLDPLSGLWVVVGVVYSNSGNAGGSICGTTTDSLIVNFNADLVVEAVDNEDGSATATVSGGTPPYAYAWSDGQTTATATGLAGGAYEVVVTDAVGCEERAELDVISSVGSIDKLASLYLGPNPTSGLLSLQLQLHSAEDIRIELRTLTGQQVLPPFMAQTAELNHDFDLGQLPNGVYLMRIVAGPDELTKRVVVAR